MIIAIVSDTHDNVYRIKNLLDLLHTKKPGLVIHCGDIVSPKTAGLFKDFNMVFVKGNCDGEVNGLKNKIKGFGEFYETCFERSIDNKKIFATHGNLSSLQEAISKGGYWIIAHGHTHRYRDEMFNNMRILNPGSLYDNEFGGVFFIDTTKSIEKAVSFKEIRGC